VDALARLLDLSREEKIERGLLYTPAEMHSSPPLGVDILRLSEISSAPGGVPRGRRFGDTAAPKQLFFSSALALPTTWAEL